MNRARYTSYTDESGVHERFLVYGGVFLPSDSVLEAEAALAALCDKRGLGDREMSWKKCSRREVDRYVEFAEQLWELRPAIEMDFRALVIDTERNALQDHQFNCATDEDGFYRFYYTFLVASLRQVAPNGTEFEIVVAELPDKYPFRTDILRATVEGGLRKRLGGAVRVASARRGSPRQRRLHQLADVLLGAVSYRFNRSELGSEKARICEAVEARTGQPLNADFRPAVRPFNVWAFSATGRRRWAKGARGTA